MKSPTSERDPSGRQDATQLLLEVETLASERDKLTHELTHLKAELFSRQALYHQAQANFERLSIEAREMTARFEEVARQANCFANIYVVNCRLMDTLERNDIYEGLKEVVINLMGSEELAIFSPGSNGSPWRLDDLFGLKPWMQEWADSLTDERLASLHSGRILRLTDEEAPVTSPGGKSVAIPLVFQGKLHAFILVGRLLPQKEALTSGDEELMEFLSGYAGRALYYADLYTRRLHNGLQPNGRE